LAGRIASALSRLGHTRHELSGPGRHAEARRRPRSAGIRVVDAPVSGGIARAETARSRSWSAGRTRNAFAVVRPVLEVLGERIFRTGPLGSGHAMKALNNFLGATAYTAAAEALAIARSSASTRR